MKKYVQINYICLHKGQCLTTQKWGHWLIALALAPWIYLVIPLHGKSVMLNP